MVSHEKKLQEKSQSTFGDLSGVGQEVICAEMWQVLKHFALSIQCLARPMYLSKTTDS
jgi:hypothetical protein